MRESLMTTPGENLAYANSLGDLHWRRWYATYERHEALLERFIAEGMSVTAAADRAAREVARKPR